MKKILAMIALSILGTFSTMAQSVDHVPAITVSDLGVFRGQYLNIILATNESSTLIFTENSLKLSSVAFQTQIPLSVDSVSLAAFDLDRNPFRLAYNLVILVISTEPQFSWRNSDFSYPANAMKSNNHSVNYVKILDRRNLDLSQEAINLRLF